MASSHPPGPPADLLSPQGLSLPLQLALDQAHHHLGRALGRALDPGLTGALLTQALELETHLCAAMPELRRSEAGVLGSLELMTQALRSSLPTSAGEPTVTSRRSPGALPAPAPGTGAGRLSPDDERWYGEHQLSHDPVDGPGALVGPAQQVLATVQGMLAQAVGCAERTVRRALGRLRALGLLDFQGHAQRHAVRPGGARGHSALYDSTVIVLGGTLRASQVRELDGHRQQFAQDLRRGRSAPGRLRMLLGDVLLAASLRPLPGGCPQRESAGLKVLACLMMAIYSVSSAAMWAAADGVDEAIGRWSAPHVAAQLEQAQRAPKPATDLQPEAADVTADVPEPERTGAAPGGRRRAQDPETEPGWEAVPWDALEQVCAPLPAPETLPTPGDDELFDDLVTGALIAQALDAERFAEAQRVHAEVWLEARDWQAISQAYADPWLAPELPQDAGVCPPESASSLAELLDLMTRPDDDGLRPPTWEVAHDFLRVAERMRRMGVVTPEHDAEYVRIRAARRAEFLRLNGEEDEWFFNQFSRAIDEPGDPARQALVEDLGARAPHQGPARAGRLYSDEEPVES